MFDSSRSTIKGAFVAFEGGGAKGLVHIGALKSMEERGFRFLGLAGTSAGAIVASLKACGYTADEMFDVKSDSKSTVLHRLPKIRGRNQVASNLFGKMGWLKVCIISIFYRLFVNKKLFSLAMLFIGTVFIAAMSISVISFKHSLIESAGIICIFTIILFIYLISQLSYGLVHMGHMENCLNELMRQKIAPNDKNYKVRMADFGRNSGRPPLKIVATNISTRRMRLFDSYDAADGNIPAAKIVTASACVPLLFKKVRIGDEYFYDGGLVSNSPTWPFDAEREVNPDAITIGIEIHPIIDQNMRVGVFLSIFEALISGAAALNQRAILGLVPIKIETKLETLDFGANWDVAKQEIDDAKIAASLQLAALVFEGPDAYYRSCQSTQCAVKEIIDAMLAQSTSKFEPTTHRVRVGVALKENADPIALRMKYCVGYDDDTDENVVLPIAGSITGRAWLTGDPIFSKMPPEAEIALPGEASRITRKLICRHIKWFLAVPVYKHKHRRYSSERPEFIIAVDGTAELPERFEVENLKSTLVEIVRNYFEQCFELSKETDNVAQ